MFDSTNMQLQKQTVLLYNSLQCKNVNLYNHDCVIVSGRIKGAARVTNVMYPCGFICNPVVLTLRRMNLIKN